LDSERAMMLFRTVLGMFSLAPGNKTSLMDIRRGSITDTLVSLNDDKRLQRTWTGSDKGN
jgi:hypothetical protein